MDALTTAPFALLLLGLITVVAMIDRGQRLGGGVHSWWKEVARAFAGAVLFAVTALSWTVACERSGLSAFFWNHTPPVLVSRFGIGDDIYAPSRGIGFLLACVTGSSLFLMSRRTNSAALPRGRRMRRSIAGFLLLAVLAAALWVPWGAVANLPSDLWHALGHESITSYTGVTSYYRVPPDLVRLREIRLEGVDLFAAVTLLLWLFQYLWGRTMQTGTVASERDEIEL